MEVQPRILKGLRGYECKKLNLSVFLWGATIDHIYQLVVNDNHNPWNSGAVLYIDIILPLVLFGLLAAGEVFRRRQANVEKAEPFPKRIPFAQT